MYAECIFFRASLSAAIRALIDGTIRSRITVSVALTICSLVASRRSCASVEGSFCQSWEVTLRVRSLPRVQDGGGAWSARYLSTTHCAAMRTRRTGSVTTSSSGCAEPAAISPSAAPSNPASTQFPEAMSSDST